MRSRSNRLVLVFMAVLTVLFSVNAAALPSNVQAGSGPVERLMVVAKSDADFNALRSDVERMGGKVVGELPQVQTLVVVAPGSFKGQIASSSHAKAAVKDGIVRIVPPSMAPDLLNANSQPQLNHIPMDGPAKDKIVKPDPAFSLPGLFWDFNRIQAPKAWGITTGRPDVLVGVADTGLDFTHAELQSKVVDVVDLTTTEDPPLCTTYFGVSDADFAAQYGGPATTDWNGHGSWIGGDIAAALDGQGMNGIAPSVGLVALKISQWCGYAYDSTIINAFLYAADHGIKVVSISFGGYLDPSDPDQRATYQQYLAAVVYARLKGTIIAAAAGNEHVRVGPGGLVLSHGSLTTPGDAVSDLFGMLEVPGGIPGVVDVAATGNVVEAPSASCPSGTADNSNATCKPSSDAHPSFGVGATNQLAYYSNYGPRIDVAAPGGARKFNLPVWDRGGTPGFPVTTTDGTAAWETFSITSNWALEIPCYVFNNTPYFPADQCYSTIQGTSMATPHVSAALALIASRYPVAQRSPGLLVTLLKQGAQKLNGNTTPGLSATDTSASDLTGATCPSGYCHLGGKAIPSSEAYGAGLIDVFKPLNLRGK